MAIPNIDYTPTSVAGIEIAIFGADNPPDTPIVFVCHGLESCMQKKFDYCRELREAGLIAITLDQRNHGRRQINPMLREESNSKTLVELLGEVAGTVRDIQMLMKFLPVIYDLSPKAFGITGTSLGGIASILAMSLEPGITACASLLGSGAIRNLFEIRMRNDEVPEEEIRERFADATGKLIDHYDPILHPERFDNRPLLMTAGELDNMVPPSCIELFCTALSEALPSPQPHKLSLYPDTGHDVTETMRAEAVQWLSRNLL